MTKWKSWLFLQGCLIAIISAQLTVLTGPEALVSSSGSVVEGAVIQIYCTVEDDTTVTFTWTLNGSSLLNDPPHIHIREDNLPERSASLLTDDSTSVLTVDNLRASDNGVYQCTATSGATSGNGDTVTLTAVSSTADGTLMLTDQPSPREPVDLLASFNDNRTGIALGGTVDGSLLICTARHQGDGVMNYPTPSVVWVRSGRVVNDTDSRITITSTTMVNGQVTSFLTITNFGQPDAGVYQCVFTDDNDGGEVITSIPYQLDTGNTIRIERVSPEVIILRPPEKLVIEVRVSGEYKVLFWYKGEFGNFIPGQMRPQEFPNYFETFVRDNTTAGNEGFYIVQAQFKSGTTQTHIITPTGGVDFGVIAPVDATTTSLSTSTVVIPEGGSADISCRSVGAPVPSIIWEVNNQPTDFEQTDTETPFVATLTGTIGNRGFDLTPGNIVSSLHIVSATYPDHDGVYTCIGTNSDDLTVASSSAFITVQVNVVSKVEINATDTFVSIGNDVTITCFVLRGNPSNYMYTITNTGTGSTTTGSTRILTDIQMTDAGTYRCNVTNDAGTGTSNTVTIELGDPPVVTTIQPDPVILNNNVDLVCVVTGNTPIEIVWELFDVTSTVEVVYTGNDTTGGNFSLIASADNYGMYRCNATSHFGMISSSIIIIQAVGPTLPADADIEVVVGSTLTLTVTITDFNLPLTEITWFIDGVPATAITGRTGVLTITNTSTTSPPATTTLTLDPVQLPSESGLYSVTAFNLAGMDTTTFNVIIAERPDSPASVSTRDVGARWVVLSWTPSFDGNKPVNNFSLYIRSVDVSDSFTLISILIPSDLISSAGELMYNVSMQGVVLPYTNYSFTVDACNDIGCSNRSDPSPIVTTDQDASSPPTGLTAEPTDTTITLTWTEPDMPNGVITHYEVSFVGTRDYDTSFRDHTDVAQLPVGDIYFPAVKNFGTTLMGLFPNTLYTVSVYPVNGAGNGMPDTRTVNTPNAKSILLIQLRLVGVDRCQQWVAENGRQKLEALNNTLFVNVEERCQCGFSVLNIMDPRFRCFTDSGDAVTYRVEVIGTETASAVEIANYIDNWIKDGALVTFDFIVIPVDSSCQVVVSSIADPECNTPAPASPTSPTSVEFPVAAVGGAIGAVTILIVVFVTAIVIIYIWIYRKRTKNVHISKTSGIEMSTVKANIDTQEGEHETLDTFQDESTQQASSTPHIYDVVELPASSHNSPPPPPASEYDYVTMGTVVDDTKDFEITDCAAYSVTGRRQ